MRSNFTPILIRHRPARVVVKRNRQTARILEVVGMILRLEHVEHERTERLRALHYERSGRIRRPAHRNAASRADAP